MSAATESTASRHFDAVVVGAGFSGLYMIYRLRELGLSVQAFERGDGVGGTWFWNRYPGARVDIEGVNYSYSFSKELEQDWVLSERYPPQPELLNYVNHVADRFDLRPHIELETLVESAVFDETTNRWAVRTDRGELISAQYVIMATGCLSAAKTPEVPGLETFGGPWYHTGNWPREGADFTGQRVGVIGTGSSGIQVIPQLAEQAAHLTVFQRTPNFTLPARNAPVDQQAIAAIKARYPDHRQQARESGFGVPADAPTLSALEVERAERDLAYQAAWDSGSLVALLTAYTDLLVDVAANETAAQFVREQIRSIVKDPGVAEALCPTDYPIGTKRPCLDTDYYATYNRDNVTLVDVKRSRITGITSCGLQTSDAAYEFDTLVFATGFDAMTGALTAMDIRGREGLSLREKWAEGPRTYLGLQSAGFPNLFMITGPGSPSLLSNMLVSIEQHVEWISACIDSMRSSGATTIEATREAEDSWVGHVQETANSTLYPRANSDYLGANVPGKARVFMPYAGGVGPYRQICDEVAGAAYKGFELLRT